jgi:hypothetical protein
MIAARSYDKKIDVFGETIDQSENFREAGATLEGQLYTNLVGLLSARAQYLSKPKVFTKMANRS